jgi:hypothetical protein
MRVQLDLRISPHSSSYILMFLTNSNNDSALKKLATFHCLAGQKIKDVTYKI